MGTASHSNSGQKFTGIRTAAVTFLPVSPLEPDSPQSASQHIRIGAATIR
jgi:hypothetical protein